LPCHVHLLWQKKTQAEGAAAFCLIAVQISVLALRKGWGIW
jgi:hypothetical protein